MVTHKYNFKVIFVTKLNSHGQPAVTFSAKKTPQYYGQLCMKKSV